MHKAKPLYLMGLMIQSRGLENGADELGAVNHGKVKGLRKSRGVMRGNSNTVRTAQTRAMELRRKKATENGNR